MKKAKVAILEVKDNGRSLEEVIKEALRLVNWKSRIHRGDTVIIKPNMGHPTYEPGVITSPEVLYHLVKLIRDRASEVIVGESDGIRYSCDDAFKNTGIGEAALKAGAKVINFSKEEKIEVKFDNSLFLRKIELPKILVESDSFITVPVIKTHEVTTLTCSLKNQFGCIPDKHRILYHHHLNEVIVDLNMLLRPKLSVVDGTIGMEGNGPIHGQKVHLNLVMAADDVVAADATVCRLIGFNPNQIKHLKLAAEKGLGTIEAKEIEILPTNNLPNKYKFKAPNPDLVTKLMLLAYRSKTLTWLFFISPLFNFLYWGAWKFRNLRDHVKCYFYDSS